MKLTGTLSRLTRFERLKKRLNRSVSRNLHEYGDGALVIILEGPDGAGKSTLAENLVEAWIATLPGVHTGEVAHVGPPRDFNPRSDNPDDLEDERIRHRIACENDLLKYPEYCAARKGTHLVVFDRMHWGSPAYGSLFRPDTNVDNYGDLGRSGFDRITRKFNDIGALTLLVMPDLNTVLERSIGRDDEYLDEVEGADNRVAQLIKIYDQYIRVAHENTSGTPRIGIRPPNYTNIVNADTHPPAWSSLDRLNVHPQTLLRVVNDRSQSWMDNSSVPTVTRLNLVDDGEECVTLETIHADDVSMLLAHACHVKYCNSLNKSTAQTSLTWRYFSSMFTVDSSRKKNNRATL